MAAPAVAQDSRGSLAFSAGAYDTGLFGGDNDAAGMFTGEYRFDYKVFGLAQPIVGGFVTTDGTVYGYFGFQSDINIGKLFKSDSDFWNRIHLRRAVLWALRPGQLRKGSRPYHRIQERRRTDVSVR